MAKPGLREHPKFLRLLYLTGVPESHAVGYLTCLWDSCYATGEPLVGDSLDVELAACFPGEPGTLTKALVDCRFIDEVSPGRFAVHDLTANAPRYVVQRIRRREQDRERKEVGAQCAPLGAVLRRKAPPPDQTRPDQTFSFCDDAKKKDAPQPAPDPIPSGLLPRDALWLAIAELMQADPIASASNIGRVYWPLRKADPPYTADDVLRLPAILQAQGFRPPPYRAGAIRDYIGWVRNPPANGAAKAAAERDGSRQLRRELQRQQAEKERAEAASGKVASEAVARLKAARNQNA